MSTRPPFPYPGGKSKVADALIALFPRARMYVEPFLGAASVFWNIPNGAYEQRVLNDIDGKLVNLFKCMRDQTNAMQSLLKTLLHSRQMYAEQLAIVKGKGCGCACHSDLDKAVAYFYCLKTAHNACPESPGNVRTGVNELKSLYNSEFDIIPYAKQLNGALIEQLDFADLLLRYDKEDAFIFADPPYMMKGAEALYDHPFSADDHVRLRDTLLQVKGRWLLTYNDCDAVRKLYEGFNLMKANWSYNTTSGKRNTDTGDDSGMCRIGKELVVTNYDVLAEVPLFSKRQLDA